KGRRHTAPATHQPPVPLSLQRPVMPDSSSLSPAPDYGLDAPGAVRNLFIAAGVGLVTWLTFKAHLWSGVLDLGPLRFPLGRMGLGATLVCGFMGAWMAWDSKFGKV